MSLRRRSKQRAAPEPKRTAKRPHPGLLRRERRALLHARETQVADLGGLLVEMYNRGSFRDDLLQERCAQISGIDDRLAQIDDLLHGRPPARRCSCGTPVLRGFHFCPNCGRVLDAPTSVNAAADTMIAPPPERG